MTVEHTVDGGVPTVAVLDTSLVDALEGAPVPDTDRSLDVRVVARDRLGERADVGDVDCVVLTPADSLDPLAAAEGLPVVCYAPREAVDADQVRALAAADDVDYVPADADVADHALLRDRVTDRVAAALTRADRDLRADAMDQAAVGITVADADHPDDALVYANQGFEDVTGYPPEYAVGRNCRFLQGEDTDPGAVTELRDAIETNEPTTVELRNDRRDGTAFWNRITLAPVRDDAGDVTHYVGIQSDVTEEIDAQRYRRRMVEITADSDRDFASKVDALLELGCERFGVDVGFLSAIGDEFEIVHADSAHPGLQPGATEPMSTTYCRRTIAADDPLVVEDAGEEMADDPAYDRWKLACYVGTNVELDGELYGTLCFADTEHAREFTDEERTFVELLATWVKYELDRQQQQARLERENDRLDGFASVVSHDLRNPLTLAQGHLEALRESDADPDTVDAIDDGLSRMAQLIDDVLTLARDGEVVDDPERVSVRAVATDAWRVVDRDAILDVADDLPFVHADAERLRTIFENLFRNAVEHGDADAITVGVDDDGLFVADDGTGIPEDERATVFDRGFTTDDDGTGFGLAIVAEIADAHGWTVDVTESDAGGARFRFDGVDVAAD